MTSEKHITESKITGEATVFVCRAGAVSAGFCSVDCGFCVAYVIFFVFLPVEERYLRRLLLLLVLDSRAKQAKQVEDGD